MAGVDEQEEGLGNKTTANAKLNGNDWEDVRKNDERGEEIYNL